MITAIIIEDDKKHIKHLLDLLTKYFPEIDVLAICENVPVAVEQVKKLQPELLFLDVELPDKTSGFDVLEQTSDLDYRVIFTSSYNKYAIRAIEFSALRYLMKPFDINKLREAIDHFKDGVSGSQNDRKKSLLDNLRQDEIDELGFCVPVKGGFEILKLGDIIFCMAQNSGTCFYLKERKTLSISKSLNWTEEMLADKNFYRTHDSYLVNLLHVKKIIHVRDGAEVTLTDEYMAEVSKRNKAKLIEIITGRKF